ncbi:head scaffolding protein [Yersinia phage phi80-18]|uniref:Scaffolding-like protein n=1 Tax=Yersinia phage phi80-18 TaxID=1206559 RepID=I7LHD4_9CAUD|nr:head scaffolding protein [Yersinia phage phi80-18]CCI88879.2 Scaffolding-like protein [Yersinia phage phi80-18]
MLFMNISRRFGAVYQEEQASEGGAPAVAPTGDAVPAAEPAAVEPAKPVAPVTPSAEPSTPADNGMQQYIDEYSEGKPALSLALGFLRDAGISPTDDAFTLAERDGDFTLLKALLAQKGLAGTDQMVAILEGAVAEHQAEQAAHEEATTAIVEGVLGENKDVILNWARENALPEEKAAMNDMLAAGGPYAHCVAIALQHMYNGADVTQPAANPVVQAKGGTSGNGPISAAEFASATQDLYNKFGQQDPRGTAEYAQLQRRREAGRTRGI